MVLHTALPQKMFLPFLRPATSRSLPLTLPWTSALGPVLLLGLLLPLKLPYSSIGYEAGNGGRHSREFYFFWRAKMRLRRTVLLTLFPCRRTVFKVRSMTKRSGGFALSWWTVRAPISNNLCILLFHIRMCDSDLWKYIFPRRRPRYIFYTECQLLPNSVHLPSYLSALHLFASGMDWRSCKKVKCSCLCGFCWSPVIILGTQ